MLEKARLRSCVSRAVKIKVYFSEVLEKPRLRSCVSRAVMVSSVPLNLCRVSTVCAQEPSHTASSSFPHLTENNKHALGNSQAAQEIDSV